MKAFIFIFFSSSIFASVNHNLIVRLYPQNESLAVRDTITLNEKTCGKNLIINLHAGLNPKIIEPRNSLISFVKTTNIDSKSDLNISEYNLSIPCEAGQIVLEYSGKISHQIKDPDDPYSRGTADSPGLISNTGTVLSSSTYWYPQFENLNDKYLTFDLEVTNDQGHSLVSQGEKISDTHFRDLSPQLEIFLIAADFKIYNVTTKNGVLVSAYLRTADQSIADTYLGATENYINRYEGLIGPYPYKKFDLVENFWDTGFGMPSFTLLGSNIIRLPFIINTSYPHEILHDWWGNSVYVDSLRGNWSEGLTAYMADHLMAELNGNADSYRRDTLQKYTDFVRAENDFPLTKFLYRYNAPTEAVGYGKSLMFFHMLRQKLGDDIFVNSLKEFYKTYKFKEVSFSEIKDSMERVSGLDLSLEFNQWVTKIGALELKVLDASVSNLNSKYILKFKLSQLQKNNIYSLGIPVAISLEGESAPIQTSVTLNAKDKEYVFSFSKRPLWLQIDPEFDVFRKLSKDESPAVLTMPLGANQTYFVIPSNVSEEVKIAWNVFIKTLSPAISEGKNIKIVDDSDVNDLPSDSTIWILGNENKMGPTFFETLKDQDLKNDENGIFLNNLNYTYNENGIVLVSKNNLKNQNLVFVSNQKSEMQEVLANKLIHYGKYSYLVFTGGSFSNKNKGVWKQVSSSMSIKLNQEDGYKTNTKPLSLKKRGSLVKN